MSPNQQIQNYKATHLIGSGGMGEVWAGQHLYMNRPVAIKCLHSRFANHPEVRARFKQEALALSQLQHPAIVRLYDYIEEADGVYLVMEYVDGDALDDYILRKTGPIPEEQAVQLMGQILEGMAYAHGQGIVHRDIKPSNFMVTPDRRVKILDFGIAKLLEGAVAKHTQTGARIGTVLYMSPEQVRGQETDLRSDIYSLGITLFQMLTGQGPYPSQSTEYEVYQKIIGEALPRAANIYPAVSVHMQAVIDRATAKRPENRFQNCIEFLNGLLDAGDVRPQKQSPASNPKAKPATLPDGKPAKKRRRGLRIMIWIFVLSLLGFLGVAGYFWVWPVVRGWGMGPREVAVEFLTAVENGDKTKALQLADEECETAVEMFLGADQKPLHRTLYVGAAHSLGPDSEVSYRYDNETQERILQLHYRNSRWLVSCNKEENLLPKAN